MYVSDKAGTRYDLGELQNDSVVRQSFVAEYDRFYSLTLWGATWGRDNNTGMFVVQLLDDAGESLEAWVIDVANMQNDADLTLYARELVPLTVGDRYWIEIVNHGSKEEQSATFFAMEEDLYPQGELLVNGQEMQGDLWMKLQCAGGQRSYMTQKTILRLLLAVLITWIAYCVMNKDWTKGKQNETNS
jgi:hypothetical protein